MPITRLEKVWSEVVLWTLLMKLTPKRMERSTNGSFITNVSTVIQKKLIDFVFLYKTSAFISTFYFLILISKVC